MPIRGKKTTRKRDTGRKRHAPIRAKSMQQASTDSTCIKYMSWNPIEPDDIKWIKTGHKPKGDMFGECRIIFTRDFPRYQYLLRAYFSYRDFKAWMNAKSVGRYWNYRLKGQV